MNAPDYQDQALIAEILRATKTIAVVGISDRADRPSCRVAAYLSAFYEIVPVNPNLDTWNGKKCYPSITAIAENIQIDLIDVFRRSSDVVPVVEEAVGRRVKYVWLQQGIYSAEAARIAAAAGIGIVMDACLLVEHARNRKS